MGDVNKNISLDKITQTPYNIDQEQSKAMLNYMIYPPNFENSCKARMNTSMNTKHCNLIDIELKLKVGEKNDKSVPVNIHNKNQQTSELDDFFKIIPKINK
jgi:hypothetical protein